jgi:purine-binding chemotaxis protein CheW
MTMPDAQQAAPSGPSSPLAYGGFALSGMQLALPMDALREVVPSEDWITLPCPNPGVVGGVNLRGVVVPVLDLRGQLGRSAAQTEFPCVLIVVAQGRLLGLLADEVTGIFHADHRGEHSLQEGSCAVTLLAGTVRRSDTQVLVSVLSVQALSQLPGVPLVQDPEPERQRTQEASDLVVIDDRADTLVLLRCGRVPMAIDALAVHATLPSPALLDSPLAMGHCRGVIEHAGAWVPAVDLHALCGLGPAPSAGAGAQAFLMAMPAGLVAFLVTEVLDVIRAQPGARVPVPAFALPRPELMHAALPDHHLPPELAERLGTAGAQFLLLEAQALMDCDDVRNLALANARQQGVSASTQAFTQGLRPGQHQRAMLTYGLAGETATPLEQVQEILPYARSVSIFEAGGPLLGFTVHKGQSIPVLCLSRLSGGQAPEASPAASVLVVQSEGELVGFAVPQLKTIESAEWEPELPEVTAMQPGVFRSRKLALVGRGDEQRMLPVLDLAQLALQVRSRQLGVMAMR